MSDIIKGFSNNKTAGPDKLTFKIIKNISQYILKPLCDIFNLCFHTAYFPKALKESVVIPIYKNGDKESVNNYRPISIISNLGKILEKAIYTRLLSFINDNGILSPKQFGFRSGKSTQDAICFLTDKIYKALDNSIPCMSIFLDLAKAFDTVDHDLLFQKLERYGIRGLPLRLIKSYFSNRKQRTKIGDNYSSELTLEVGVPQGTVLGPLFFILYINSLLTLELNSEIISYADDTAVYIEGDSWEQVRIKAVQVMTVIKQWLVENKLTLNILKSNFVTFSCNITSQSNFDFIETHDSSCKNSAGCKCEKISKKDNIRYLGVDIDSHLRWNIHISRICKNLRKTIYI